MSTTGLRAESEKPRSRKEEEAAEASQPKKSLKKVVVIEQNGSFQLRIPKNFICEHCYGAFRSSYHLKRHILIHTGEKPFECDVCDMRFIQKYHLERHKRVHSGEKPYQCERCLQDKISVSHPWRLQRSWVLGQDYIPSTLLRLYSKAGSWLESTPGHALGRVGTPTSALPAGQGPFQYWLSTLGQAELLQDRPAAETQTDVPRLPNQDPRLTAAALGAEPPRDKPGSRPLGAFLLRVLPGQPPGQGGREGGRARTVPDFQSRS
ncbi:zinc finger protein 740 isoform X3 [Alligator sinensis]|uniref:Zinc finger protein 740 isoform X3 n=1 Tax=Alligator sinensis TaxID=38654 RepID=A0A3Q0HC81_ALLSI|nr:zinc finger protein 740 isoform X3 [Alligator sinensis]